MQRIRKVFDVLLEELPALPIFCRWLEEHFVNPIQIGGTVPVVGRLPAKPSLTLQERIEAAIVIDDDTDADQGSD